MGATKRRGRSAPYHHGDLRQALVETGAKLVETEGVAALKLRAVARKAGVSHMAPYNHFADRAELVAAVAAEGFRRLRDTMEERMAGFPGRPARQLQEAGVAYVGFAAGSPELFRLMFSPELADKTAYPELQEAARRTFAVLADVVARTGGARDSAPTPSIVPLVAWSFVHGLAVLLLDHQFAPPVGVQQAEDFARAATEILWVGIGPRTA